MTIAITIPPITNPIPSSNNPTFGWNLSQLIDIASIKRGRHTIKAAMNIAIPTTDDKNPPRKGTYPNIDVIGLKKAQIDKTINM